MQQHLEHYPMLEVSCSNNGAFATWNKTRYRNSIVDIIYVIHSFNLLLSVSSGKCIRKGHDCHHRQKKYSLKQTKLVPSGFFLTRFPLQLQEITGPGLAPLAEYSCKFFWHSQKESMLRRVLEETHLVWLVIDAQNVSRVLMGHHVTWSVSFGLVS